MEEQTNDVGFKPVADDNSKACKECSVYAEKEPGKGDCMGHEVPETGTCNYFAPKAEKGTQVEESDTAVA